MNFTYRGVTFEAPIAGTEAHETEQTGTFLGKAYKMKQANISGRQGATEFTYRGVHYTR